MKHILIDGTTISSRMDGLSQYILNVTLNWELTPGYRYTLLVRPNECPPLYLRLFKEKGFQIEEVNIAPIGPIRDLQFARYLLKRKHFDAAFIPSNQYPIAMRLPALYTIHDLIYEQFPEQLGRGKFFKRWYLRFVTHVGLFKAKEVVAVSQYTCNEILRYHGRNYEENIHVIHEGWEHLLFFAGEAYGYPKDVAMKNYILYVGSSREHKNLGRLIKAIKNCYQELPEDWGFVFIGNNKMLTSKYQKEINEINKEREIVQITGWQEDQSLANYYRHARALIFPSLSEGFGIPVLEAYFYRIPLLLSNQASLPEIAGNAAIYFNPYDVKDISRTIVNFIQQPNHDALIERQTQRLSRYSWKNTSKQLKLLLQQIAKSV